MNDAPMTSPFTDPDLIYWYPPLVAKGIDPEYAARGVVNTYGGEGS